MSIVLRGVANAQLDDAAIENADPLQLRGRRSDLGKACLQRLDHVLSRHCAGCGVRVLMQGTGGEVGWLTLCELSVPINANDAPSPVWQYRARKSVATVYQSHQHAYNHRANVFPIRLFPFFGSVKYCLCNIMLCLDAERSRG